MGPGYSGAYREFLHSAFEQCRQGDWYKGNFFRRFRIDSSGSKLVFAVALKTFCNGIILAHNHPSQQLSRSEADLTLIKKLTEAGKLLGIQVLDHLILGKYGYYSFQNEGVM